MFDIGFAELLVIAVLGLLILGPERLPGAIKTASLWLGRLKRSFSDIRREIEREIGADEIRQQLHNESVMASLKESEQKLRSSVSNANQELQNLERSAKNSLEPETTDSPEPEPNSPEPEPGSPESETTPSPEFGTTNGSEENTVTPPKADSKNETP